MLRSILMTVAVAVMLLPVTATAAGKKSGAKAPLDKVALKLCVELEKDMSRQIDRYNVQVNQSNAELKKINALRAEINAMQDAVKAGDPVVVDVYNEKIQQHNTLAGERGTFDERLAAAAAEHERLRQQFNSQCSGRRFMQSDLHQIQKGRK